MEHFSVCFRQCCWNRKPCTTLKRKIKHREIKSRTVQQQNLHHEDQGQTGKKNKKRNQTFWVCRWKSTLLWAPLLAVSFCCKETDFPKYIQMCANTHDVFLIPPGTRSWFIPNFDLPVFPDNLCYGLYKHLTNFKTSVLSNILHYFLMTSSAIPLPKDAGEVEVGTAILWHLKLLSSAAILSMYWWTGWRTEGRIIETAWGTRTKLHKDK